MKPQFIHILCGFLPALLPFAGISQPAIEFVSGSGPAGNGSVITNQVITFEANALNPTTGTYSPFSPTVTATFAISNQQYVLPASQNSNGGDISFGATNNASGALITGAPTFPAMNWISAPANADFSATPLNIGAGIDVGINYAVEIFSSTEGLYNANLPTNGRYYMADLTITFNIPLTNPVLHIVGIGGTYNALGFTTELQLVTTGVTLSKLSGSKELNVTSTAILNSASAPTATTGAGAASGSILVTGSSVTSLHFQIYMRGNGKTPTWSNAIEHTGDAWMIGVSAENTLIELPIGISSFMAKPQQHSVGLQWTTASEQNSDYFTIQRSSDGANWTGIGQVTAAGNSNQTLQYQFIDDNPASGANFYRLRETGDNGALTYSPIRNVDFDGSPIAITWYPNPVHDQLTITSTSTIQSAALTTIDGRILQLFGGLASGQTIDMSRYPFGIYFLAIRTTDGVSRVAKIERN
ncbi:MAG TPA: T9SS type A sorting domain-containing protein [Puia sp.]|nr:T9SS type A sorting domain-containing protein [Puia sp.]